MVTSVLNFFFFSTLYNFLLFSLIPHKSHNGNESGTNVFNNKINLKLRSFVLLPTMMD